MVRVSRVGYKPKDNEILVYIGRKSSYKLEYGLDYSSLGNPFFMKTESERDKVCDQFDLLFEMEVRKEGSIIRHAVKDLYYLAKTTDKDLVLLCFCSPRRCHGDTIAKFLNEALTPSNTNS